MIKDKGGYFSLKRSHCLCYEIKSIQKLSIKLVYPIIKIHFWFIEYKFSLAPCMSPKKKNPTSNSNTNTYNFKSINHPNPSSPSKLALTGPSLSKLRNSANALGIPSNRTWLNTYITTLKKWWLNVAVMTKKTSFLSD